MKVNGKLKERGRYLRMVGKVQDEFSKQFIHDKLRPAEVTKRICSRPGGYICDSTVRRFLQYGRSGKRMFYVRGPYFTTVFAVAEALGFSVNVTHNKE